MQFEEDRELGKEKQTAEALELSIFPQSRESVPHLRSPGRHSPGAVNDCCAWPPPVPEKRACPLQYSHSFRPYPWDSYLFIFVLSSGAPMEQNFFF